MKCGAETIIDKLIEGGMLHACLRDKAVAAIHRTVLIIEDEGRKRGSDDGYERGVYNTRNPDRRS